MRVENDVDVSLQIFDFLIDLMRGQYITINLKNSKSYCESSEQISHNIRIWNICGHIKLVSYFHVSKIIGCLLEGF